MAYTDVRDPLLYWTQSGIDAERKRTKDIRDGLTWNRERKQTIASRFPKISPATSLEPKWWTGVTYQTRITGTLTTSTMVFSGYLFNAAINEDALRQFVKAGTILERESDGMKVQLSTTQADITYSTYTAINCTAHGNHTLSDDTTAATYKILATPVSDYTDTFMPRSLDVSTLKCGHQTLKENFEIPWLTKSIAYDAIKDPKKTNIAELIKKLDGEINNSLLRMEPVYSAGSVKFGYETQVSTICGALHWAKLMYEAYPNDNIFFTKSGVPLDPDDINKVIRGLYYDENSDFNAGSWCMAVDPITHAYISRFGLDDRQWMMDDNEYGYYVRYFMSEIGQRFEVVPDVHMRPGCCAIMNTSAFEWAEVSGDSIRTIALSQDNTRVDKVMITGSIVGTIVENPRKQIGLIYGLPTTFA